MVHNRTQLEVITPTGTSQCVYTKGQSGKIDYIEKNNEKVEERWRMVLALAE